MQKFILLLVASLLFVSSFAFAQQPQQYAGYPPVAPNQVQHSGRFVVNNKTGKALFYWFIDTTNDINLPEADIPITVWLSGGPGCASGGLATFFENQAPMVINKATGALEPSKGPFTAFSRMIWLDSPCGVGYSTCGTGPADTTTEEAADDFYAFLQAFMEHFPQYSSSRVGISAESFGGTWAPTFAYRIFEANRGTKPMGKYRINLYGIEIGNGLTDPTYQYPQYSHLAYEWCKVVKGEPCVTYEQYQQMRADLPACIELIAQCTKNNVTAVCDTATSYCNAKQMNPYMENGWNFYDIRRTGNYDMNYITTFMNRRDVQMSLLGQTWNWQSCNMSVNSVFSRSWEHDRTAQVIEMLEGGIRILVLGGMDDFAVNWLGCKAWAINLPWSGQSDFTSTPDTMWFTNEKPAGFARSVATKGGKMGFSFVGILNAGHLVPHDQPYNMQQMMIHFVKDEPFYSWPGPLFPGPPLK